MFLGEGEERGNGQEEFFSFLMKIAEASLEGCQRQVGSGVGDTP